MHGRKNTATSNYVCEGRNIVINAPQILEVINHVCSDLLSFALCNRMAGGYLTVFGAPA